jgi:hypothetical protein
MHFRDAYDPFRALGGAWNLVARAPATLVVGTLLLFFLEAFSVSLSVDESGVLLPTLVSACCCFGLVFWLASCLLQIGLAGAVQAAARGERERFGILFEPRERFLALLLARVGKWLAWMVSSLPFGVMVGGPIALGEALDLEPLGIVAGVLGGLLYLPLWAWLVLGLVLVEEAVAFEGRDPVAAFRRSFELARGHRLQLLAYTLVMLVLTLGGCCLCLIGVLVTGPWARLAWFESFQRLSEPAAPA